MKGNRFTVEQIVRALKEVETGGKKAIEQQREIGRELSHVVTSGSTSMADWKRMKQSV